MPHLGFHMNAGKTLASAVALVTFGRRRIVGSIKALLAWRQLLAVAGGLGSPTNRPSRDNSLPAGAHVGTGVGASTGSGSDTGSRSTPRFSSGPVVNVGPLANTGTQAAPPDFDTTQTAVSATWWPVF